MSNVGNVYVFNSTPNTVTLILNGQLVTGSLTGITQGSGYAPNSTTVARNSSPGNPGNNTFGGTNSLIVSFAGGGAQTYPVNISLSQAQIASDLQLYLFYNEVILVLPDGTAGPGSSEVIVGSAVPPEEVAAYTE